MEYPSSIPANDPPPAGVNVLAQTDELGWWQAIYLPDQDNPAYQPEAWEFVGLDGFSDEVIDWMPLPPRKPR